ncbi:hypothetical protein [Maritalea sp.]|jgi:serine O-acetyltransferase|uniref:hypothetical protein n=1 Tax=Maritalea sp. TaxID=2003361 RepID=UPI0039E6E633
MNNAELAKYVTQQLANLLPDTDLVEAQGAIAHHLPQALDRLHHLISKVKMWTPGKFDHLHSTQYCTFLYLLSHEIWQQTGEREWPTRLFLLNKAMNGIDLFYEIEMPPVFFIGHSVGIVLAKATYGNYLVLYQNSTIGKNHGTAPVIGERVIMYPNTAIIGRCNVGNGTVLSQGTGLINCDSPGQCNTFMGPDGRPTFNSFKSEEIPATEYFRF